MKKPKPNEWNYKGRLEKWKKTQVEMYKRVPPSKLSQSLLRSILSHYGILQKGCRELQEWRLLQFRAGHPVQKSVLYTPNLNPPRFLLFSFDQRSIVLPRDLFKFIILPNLGLSDLFSLMKTCKSFSGIAHAELTRRARVIFNHERATPLAFSYWTRLNSLSFEYEKLALLKIPYVPKMDNQSLIHTAIIRHGYIDHLRTFPNLEQERKTAKSLEAAYIESHREARTNAVQSRLNHHGYGFLTIGAISDTIRHSLQCMTDWDYVHELQEYIRMEKTREIDTIIGFMKPPRIMEKVIKLDTRFFFGIRAIQFGYLLNSLIRRNLSEENALRYVHSIYDLCRSNLTMPVFPTDIIWEHDYTITIRTT